MRGRAWTRDARAREEATIMGGQDDLFDLRFLRVEEVARVMGVSKMTIYRLINSGDLPADRFGKTYRVREGELRAYLDRSRVVPGSMSWAEADGEVRAPDDDE
jgi:excisionase family DNA binding protein